MAIQEYLPSCPKFEQYYTLLTMIPSLLLFTFLFFTLVLLLLPAYNSSRSSWTINIYFLHNQSIDWVAQ